MSNITAKITCQSKVTHDEGADSEQVRLTFVPDYNDGRNKEWARYTPALSLSMSVLPEVAEQFETGAAYTLTFTPEEN